jgi:hypothetical protein
MKSTGQLLYEADVLAKPRYHDGKPRKTWDELDPISRWSWEKPLREDMDYSQKEPGNV